MEKRETLTHAIKIATTAQAIVFKMISAGLIESEPEADMWQHEISKILRNKF